MSTMMKRFSTFFSFVLLALVISGCSDQEQDYANKLGQNTAAMYKKLPVTFEKLKQEVDYTGKRGKYETALLVALEKVQKENPDSEAIDAMVKQFKLDMTTKGSIFKAIQDDYNAVRSHQEAEFVSKVRSDENVPKNKINSLENFNNELFRIQSLLKPEVYDERYIDYINTLAAVSTSVTPVIVDKVDTNASFGSQFVGNPHYGEWKTDKQGNTHWSFWETYGFISFIDDMIFDGGRHYGSYSYYDYNRGYGSYNRYSNRYRYDTWKNTRNYSYYNDVYANKYEKPSIAKKYNSNLSKYNTKYKSTIKKDSTVARQNTKIAKTHKQYSSNLLDSKKLKSDKSFKSKNTNSFKSVRSSKTSVSKSSGK